MLDRTAGRGRKAQEWQMYLHRSSYSIHPPRLLNSSERLGKRCELFYNEKLDLDLCIWELFFFFFNGKTMWNMRHSRAVSCPCTCAKEEKIFLHFTKDPSFTSPWHPCAVNNVHTICSCPGLEGVAMHCKSLEVFLEDTMLESC